MRIRTPLRSSPGGTGLSLLFTCVGDTLFLPARVLLLLLQIPASVFIYKQTAAARRPFSGPVSLDFGVCLAQSGLYCCRMRKFGFD